MKKTKYNLKLSNKILLGAFVLGMTFTGCQKSDNDIFDVDPIVRLDNIAKSELQYKLVDSENGWIVTFSPDGSTYLGEYNLWMEFSKDWSCKIKSDLNMTDLVAESTEYNFVKLKTIALSFPLGNKVHEFTAMGPEDLRTDIEFVFSKYIDENTIEFEGHMTKQKIYFKKATAEDKKFVFSEKWDIYNKINTITRSVVTVNGKVVNYKWNNIEEWRSAQIGDSKTGYLTSSTVVTFQAAEDGKSVKLVPSLALSDGSTIDRLDLVGNSFIGLSSTNAVIVLN